jgi:uncharacterized membrane protein YqjE
MEIIDNQGERVERLSDHLIEYLDTRWDLIVLSLAKKTSNVVSGLASSLILGVFGLLVLLFLSIGLAVYLGSLFGNQAAGFFAVAGVYALLLVIALLLARNMIRSRIATTVIELINNDDQERHE